MQLGKHAATALAALLALAGTAQAAVTVVQGKKGVVITGDSASDRVDIEGSGAVGAVVVHVNLAGAFPFIGVADIKVKLAGGNDVLRVAGIHIGGTLSVDTGAGDDVFDLDTTPDVGPAADHDVFIGADVAVKMGGQSGDVVDWDAEAGLDIAVGGDVIIAQSADVDLDGDGSTSLAEAADIHIGGNLKVTKHVGVDSDDGWTVELDDVNVHLGTVFQLGKAANAVAIADSRFVGSVSIVFGSGDDVFSVDILDGANDFNGPLTVQAGQGNDVFEIITNGADNEFTFPPSVSGFEVVQ